MLILSNMVKDKDFDPWTHQTMDTPDFDPKPWIHLVTTMHAPLSRGGYTPPVPSSTMDTPCFVPKPWIHLYLHPCIHGCTFTMVSNAFKQLFSNRIWDPNLSTKNLEVCMVWRSGSDDTLVCILLYRYEKVSLLRSRRQEVKNTVYEAIMIKICTQIHDFEYNCSDGSKWREMRNLHGQFSFRLQSVFKLTTFMTRLEY